MRAPGTTGGTQGRLSLLALLVALLVLVLWRTWGVLRGLVNKHWWWWWCQRLLRGIVADMAVLLVLLLCWGCIGSVLWNMSEGRARALLAAEGRAEARLSVLLQGRGKWRLRMLWVSLCLLLNGREALSCGGMAIC